MKRRRQAPEICPVCGATVPPRARACPACGADDRSGWNDEERLYDGLDLPDEEFDYEDFVAREFGEGPSPRRRFKGWQVGVILLMVVIMLGLASYLL